jgi:DNA-directed RNA polymerase II subunit RPB2|tara:strand:- start:1973 stop:4966 length:2994 start_codon:yes stop_codon:yes gene_type:complete
MNEFASGVSLTKQTRASYDAFLDRIPMLLHNHDIFAQKFTMSGERWVRVQMVGLTLENPKVLEADGSSNPLDIRTCRLRNLTYNIPMYTTVHIHRSDGPSSVHPNVYIGRVPLMVGSKHCNSNLPEYDHGGYFICNGSEKTIINQKAHVHNTMMTLHRIQGGVEQWAVCCKSEDDHRGVMSTSVRYVPGGPAMVLFPKVKEEISIGGLLSILPEPNYVSLTNEQIVFFGLSDEKQNTVEIVNTFCLGDSASDRQTSVLQMLLPHTTSKSDYLILMLQKLYNDIHAHKWADKDSLMYQRIEMVEDLLYSLTHNLLCKMKHDISMRLHRKLTGNIRDETILKMLSTSSTVMDGIQYALSTGNWRTNAFDGRARVGVAQLLQRATIYTALSQLRRVSSSIKPEQKLSLPRYIHGTHRGRLCYVETPEGSSCGLESQLSVGAYISIKYPPQQLVSLVQPHLVQQGRLVFVNGHPIGFGDIMVVQAVRSARRSGQIAKDVSVSFQDHIHIRSNSGRICRPLIILPRKIKSFQEMLDQGLLEYVDVYEEDTLVIGETHEELDPTLLMGLCAATIPYSNHNPAPRNTYQAAMMKQAQSVPTLDFADRWDTTSNVIHYGQKPLVTTGVERAYGYELPMGQNCIVAIMPAEYNQEDSTIWNQSSIDRGIGRTTTFKTVKDTLGSDESYSKPVPKRRGRYNVADNGIPCINQKINIGDCVIGKIRRSRVGNKMEDSDVSVFAQVNATVDKVLCYKERDGTPGMKVKLRKQRIPMIGDKFASRSAQKGTIGLIVPQEDMPFCLSGVVPDVILNPHALPSRMTMAQMLETIKSKYACFAGLQDGSPFNGDTVDSIGDMLHSVGFSSGGTEVMMDGRTGQRYRVPIFIGPTFYQRLKHNSADKMHARARGRRDLVTHQPNEGRASGGGLRVGEMEKDSFVSHGVPHVLTERLLYASDPHEIDVCSCGYSHSLHNGVCQLCGGAAEKKLIPYGFHLLIQELQSMCVNVKLK